MIFPMVICSSANTFSASPNVIPTKLGTVIGFFTFMTILTEVPLFTLVAGCGLCEIIKLSAKSGSFPFSIAPMDNPNLFNRSLACSKVNPFKSGIRIASPPLLTVK